MSQALRHIDTCITHNRRIDRKALTEMTGISGRALDRFICQAICAFVLRSQGGTGSPAAANKPRDGKLKRVTTYAGGGQ